MTPTWTSDGEPESVRFSLAARVRLVFRGVLLAALVFGGLALLLLIRLLERPLFGAARPWTPHVTVFVCRNAFRILGLKRISRGEPMMHAGALVANHSSWLDIFALNAGGPLYFVSKSEVAAWPGIGWLARATGTVFVNRTAREAGAQKALLERRFSDGHRLLFFPEGTSTDGQRVLTFKPTLFAALYSEQSPDDLWVQPVTVVYHAPGKRDARFYGWWGDMDFAPHLAQILAQSPQGSVEVTWHEPLAVANAGDRKSMARAAEAVVRSVHPRGAV